jgi:hypothetical protein
VRVPPATHLLALCRTPAEAEAALAALRLILAERGLELKDAKTRIVHLAEGGEGVDFLGFHHRKGPRQARPVSRSLALTQGDAACPRPDPRDHGSSRADRPQRNRRRPATAPVVAGVSRMRAVKNVGRAVCGRTACTVCARHDQQLRGASPLLRVEGGTVGRGRVCTTRRSPMRSRGRFVNAVGVRRRLLDLPSEGSAAVPDAPAGVDRGVVRDGRGREAAVRRGAVSRGHSTGGIDDCREGPSARPSVRTFVLVVVR